MVEFKFTCSHINNRKRLLLSFLPAESWSELTPSVRTNGQNIQILTDRCLFSPSMLLFCPSILLMYTHLCDDPYKQQSDSEGYFVCTDSKRYCSSLLWSVIFSTKKTSIDWFSESLMACIVLPLFFPLLQHKTETWIRFWPS